MDKISEKVWVIDFGSQYTQLIARRIRECGVYSEIKSPTIGPQELNQPGLKALVLSGGPASVSDRGAPQLNPEIFSCGLPILGICYGLQLISHYFGGEILSSASREYGRAEIQIKDKHPLFYDVRDHSIVWMSHGDHVGKLPSGFRLLAESKSGVIAGIADDSRKIYGLQFHPEVAHTEEGKKVLSNFLYKIALCQGEWSPEIFVKSAIQRIREEVKEDRVLVAMSGGVDSSVMSVLLHRAIGDKSIPVFVNNGLLRKAEEIQVIQTLREKLGIPVKLHDYSNRFLHALRRVRNPEKKRKIIGNVFIEAFEEIAKAYPNVRFLAQGTLYPDVIESRSVNGPSAVIKSHHNVGGLPERLNFRLIEPLSELFKDEVRAVGKSLGIPEDILSRHPFPGPGLGVRILGAVTPERIAILQEADHIFISGLKKWNLYSSVWQAFAVLLPVKTVGVMGDRRTYEYVCSLRAVTSLDGMTADWAPLPHDFLSAVATEIVNQVKGINRVVYDITSKPPGTIEWE